MTRRSKTLARAIPEAAQGHQAEPAVGPGAAVRSATPQRWGVAVACAVAARNPRLRDAVVAGRARDAGRGRSSTTPSPPRSLMAMNNVYYRFRHVVGKPTTPRSRRGCA